MITNTTLQTIKALLELSKLPAGKAQGVVSIAKKIRAPENYLGKVMQRLAREGVVISQKGLNGGFRLARDPAKISLYDVASVLEDLKRWEGCFMGKGACSKTNACSAHKHWEGARKAYLDFLNNTSIADLGEK